jgi:uncharacterized protein
MRVDQLWRFPVKSLLGERVEEVTVTERGVAGDRQWALVGGDDGKVVSAKNPRKWRRTLELSAAFDDAAGQVAITFPDGRVVRSDEAGTDEALSDFLGRPVRLASTAPPGATFEESWPDVEGLAPEEFIASTRIATDDPAEVTSDIGLAMMAPGTFFDLASLHLVTTSTLAALQAAQPEGTFDVRRYRPNVLVSTDGEGTGYVENEWVGRRVTFGAGGAAMEVALPTMRCIMTTMAMDGLPADPSLLRTVARENRLDIGGGKWACVGVYGGVAGTGTVRVGDEVALAPSP